MTDLKKDNPSFVLHGIEDVKFEDVSCHYPQFTT